VTTLDIGTTDFDIDKGQQDTLFLQRRRAATDFDSDGGLHDGNVLNIEHRQVPG
jgi:hypothetical protein